MSARTVRVIAAEQAVLSALMDGPKSAREISRVLIDGCREAWAERHGYDIEWGSDSEPLGARLLAHCEAEENGCVWLCGHEVYPVLRRLERRGMVSRFQIEGHRPVLWAVPGSSQ